MNDAREEKSTSEEKSSCKEEVSQAEKEIRKRLPGRRW